MVRFVSIFCLMFSAVLLAGCSVGNTFGNGAPQVVAAPDPVSARLAEAADRVSTALETLAAVESKRTPNVALAPVADAPQELRRAITVNWVGPVEPVLKMLADRANYSYQAYGNNPANELVVSLDVENTPIVEVMRDIGLQLGNYADVKVSAKTRSVEIHYAPVQGLKTRG